MRLRWTAGVAVAGVALLMVLGLTVSVPLVVLRAGPTVDVLGSSARGQQVLEVSGTQAYPTTGQLRMATIAVTEDITGADMLAAWLSGAQVVPRELVYEPGRSPEAVDAENRSRFDQAERDAAAAAAAYLRRPQQPVVSFDINDVGGPSAGLIFAIGIVDRVTPGDMLDRRTVAGTGTIDPQGRVGAVGGIGQKIAGAQAAGATVFLVPASECEQARTYIPPGMTAVRVGSLGEAIDSLSALRLGQPPATC